MTKGRIRETGEIVTILENLRHSYLYKKANGSIYITPKANMVVLKLINLE